MGEQLFTGQAGRLVLAGNTMHADVPTVAPGSGAFGWVMTMLAQEVDYPKAAPAGWPRPWAIARWRPVSRW